MNQTLERLLTGLVDHLPRAAITRAFGAVADCEFPPPLQAALNESLSSIVGIDRSEMVDTPADYPTINDVFTRPLRPGARPIATDDPAAVVAPVDGTLTRFGRIDDGTMFRVKGRRYGIRDIVGTADDAAAYRDGSYAIFYLSPRDYHRIHSPTAGRIRRFLYRPGGFFPVNEVWVRHVDNLFATNERIVSFLETFDHGTVAFVKVGAACVAKTTLTFHDFDTGPHPDAPTEYELEAPADVVHGAEVGAFALGSTVLLLFEDADFDFADDLVEGEKRRMGTLLGRFSDT